MDEQTYVTTAPLQMYPEREWWGVLGACYTLPGGTALQPLAPVDYIDDPHMVRVRVRDIYLPPAVGLVRDTAMAAAAYTPGPGLREGGLRRTCTHGRHTSYHCLPCLYARWTDRARERGIPLTPDTTGETNHE